LSKSFFYSLQKAVKIPPLRIGWNLIIASGIYKVKENKKTF